MESRPCPADNLGLVVVLVEWNADFFISQVSRQYGLEPELETAVFAEPGITREREEEEEGEGEGEGEEGEGKEGKALALASVSQNFRSDTVYGGRTEDETTARS